MLVNGSLHAEGSTLSIGSHGIYASGRAQAPLRVGTRSKRYAPVSHFRRSVSGEQREYNAPRLTGDPLPPVPLSKSSDKRKVIKFSAVTGSFRG
jgi:hypothetical protein